MRGYTRWPGYLIHVTETCDDGAVNLVTDVATTVATIKDSEALGDIHSRLGQRGLLPAEHLVDGGYATLGQLHAAHRQQIALIGPIGNNSSWQKRANTGFARTDFTIDFDKHQVTCPQGKISGNWLETESPGQPPTVIVKFNERQCDPCPSCASCTRSREGRSVNFPPRHLHELQQGNREHQDHPHWLRAYGSRSGVEGTVAEFVGGHGARRCRYHGLAKTHVQHVLTAVAVNIERLHNHARPDHRDRQTTALQQYLITRELPIPRWWGGH